MAVPTGTEGRDGRSHHFHRRYFLHRGRTGGRSDRSARHGRAHNPARKQNGPAHNPSGQRRVDSPRRRSGHYRGYRDGTTDPTTGTSDVSDAAVGPASNVTTAPDGSSVPPPDETGGLGTGAIVGIVIAAVVVLAGAGAAVYFLVIRKKNPEEPGDPGQESE